MTLPGFHSDRELAQAWVRSTNRHAAVMPSEMGTSERLRLYALAGYNEPLVVLQTRRDYATECVHVNYLRAVGVGAEMAAVLFKNIMAMWPPDMAMETFELLSRKQLGKAFGQPFGALLADALHGGRQPVLQAFVRRRFDGPVTRHFETATMVWDGGGPVNASDSPQTVSHIEATDLAYKHGFLKLLTTTHFRPEHDFYADVLKAGEALWQALGTVDGDR